jgi:signal transduction histidine kinase
MRLGRGTVIAGYCDRVWLDQAVTNLLSSATKYGTNITSLIRVQDQGVGIPHQELEGILDRYEQGGSRSKDHGWGLGLWITRRIIEAHGGTIVAESELDKGSVFTIEIPVAERSITARSG